MSRWEARIEVVRERFSLKASACGDAGVVAVVGPNGSGKTTFLRALAGAAPLHAGVIRVGERTWDDVGNGVHLPMEERHVGYVPQGFGLFPHLSVTENVMFGLRGLSAAQREERVRSVLSQLECAHLADRRVSRLSGGESQRIALARALVTDPVLLLLDEPLSSLDATTRRQVRHFLAKQLAALRIPTVLVTHDLRDAAAFDAQVLVLEAGRVVQFGSLDALRSAPASDFVAEFVGA